MKVKLRDAIRDAVFMALGCWMLIHETIGTSPRWLLIAAAFGLLGLPFTIRWDDKSIETRERRLGTQRRRGRSD